MDLTTGGLAEHGWRLLKPSTLVAKWLFIVVIGGATALEFAAIDADFGSIFIDIV